MQPALADGVPKLLLHIVQDASGGGGHVQPAVGDLN